MTPRERIRTIFSGEIPDRVGTAEAPWPETRARWHTEGIPADIHANDFFGLDIRNMVRCDCSFRLPTTVIADADDHRLVRGPDGVTEKQWKHSGVPQHVDHLLKGAADWERLKGNLTPSVDRIGFGYYGDYGHEYVREPISAVKRAYEQRVGKDCWLMMGCVDPYEALLSKMGDVALLTLMVEDPDLARDMFEHYTGFLIAQFDLMLAQGIDVDAIAIGGDLAYKNGMLFSPATYRKLLLPCHRRIFEHVHARGKKVYFHTDGNCMKAVPMLIEAGIDLLQPLEVVAGMDLETVVKQFGKKLALMGNISAPLLASNGDAAIADLERKLRFVTANRVPYIYHSDHSLPPTPLATMQRVFVTVERLGRY